MMRVLVAEKSREARQRIVEALAAVDTIAVQGAVAELRAAVSALSVARPDLLVVGIELDDGSGLELIEAAHEIAPGSRIVVVGDASDRQIWRAHLAAGADRFVEPDPEMTELRDVVAKLAAATPLPSRDDELRLLGRMAAGVAHDLNNYLGVIAALLDHLARTRPDAGSLAEARAAADQATRLLGTLLAYVRGTPAQAEPLDLGSLVERTLALVGRALPARVMVNVEVDRRTPRVRGVATELEQLVLNLVLNAADAMPGGGELTVRVRPTSCAAAYLEVSDTGTGVQLEVPLRVGDATPSTKPGRRAGLGLGIVRRVVERHGGAFAIAPRRDRTGTIATILLPTT